MGFKMVMVIGEILIWKNNFCLLKIILYIILFNQVNWISQSFSLKQNLYYIWTMSFSSYRDIHYLVDLILLLITNSVYEYANYAQAPAIRE